MNEYNYTDFLIKKSVQPFSLRNLHGAVNQNQNLTLHLNKRAAQLRQDEGETMNTMDIIESKKLQVHTLPDADRYVKQITHPKQIDWRLQMDDKDNKKITQLMNQDKYTDDVMIVSEGSKITSKNVTAYQRQMEKLKKQKAIWTIENKLKFVMADKIKFQEIKRLHKNYVTEKVKRNFWEQRFNKNEETTPLSQSQNNSVQLDTSNNNIARSTAEYFKILRGKSKDIGRINTQNSQHVNAKDVVSYEVSPTNSQFSTSRVTFFDVADKAQKNMKGQKKETGITNNESTTKQQNQNQAKQHFIELDKNNLPSRIHSNNTTQHTSYKHLKEVAPEKLKLGGSVHTNYNESDTKKKVNEESNIKKQDSLHAHFEIDFDNQKKIFEVSKETESQINQQNHNSNLHSHENKLSFNKIDSKLSFGYHEGGTMININPFNSDIFISNKEFENEKSCKEFNPGEMYEQLREINNENEKKLIDSISKKNKFQLVDLFPSSVKTKPFRYISNDIIQLCDFDKATFLKNVQKKREKEKEYRKSADFSSAQGSRKQSLKENKEYLKTDVSQPKKLTSGKIKTISDKLQSQEDQIVESQTKQPSPQKKRKLNKRKIQSQCIQRLSKNTDDNSIQYLRKYGLEETINLKDDFSKFRLTAATTTANSQKTIQFKNSFEINGDEIEKLNSLPSSPRNDPYLLKKDQNIKLSAPLFHSAAKENKYDLLKQDKDQFNIHTQTTTTAATSNYGGYLNTKQDNRFSKFSSSPTKVRNNSNQDANIKSFQINKSQLSSMTALKSDKDIQPFTSNPSLNCLLTPLTKQEKENNGKNQYIEQNNKSDQPLSNIFKNRINPFQFEQRPKVTKSSHSLSKSYMRVQEKQNNIKSNLQLKEDFINFYDNVIITSKEQAQSSNSLNKQIKRMVKKVDKNLASIQASEGPKLSTLSHEFRDFKEMKIFKRKFFNYAVNKIHPDDRKSLFELYSMTHRKQVEEIFAQQMKK